MAAYLILPDGRSVAARDGLVLGRDPGCDVVVKDRKASRRHAALRIAGTVAEIEDLESSNGTLLNGKRVQRRLLRDGDRIQIGAWTIAYREQGAASAAAAGEESTFAEELPAAAPPPAAPPPAGVPADPARTEAAAAEPTGETLEFLDEVVQVRVPPPAKPSAPGGGASASRRAPPAGGPGRVLQFHQRPDRRGLLAEDLRQMSMARRLLLLLLALALAAVMGYFALQLVR